MKIDTWSSEPGRPYANLEPIVDALVGGGNELVSRGFQATRAGWECRLAKQIDFEMVASRFSLPPNVDSSPRYDSILDRHTWCVIEGALADERRYLPVE